MGYEKYWLSITKVVVTHNFFFEKYVGNKFYTILYTFFKFSDNMFYVRVLTPLY